MSVIVFAETNNGKPKKSSVEAVFYGSKIAALLNSNVCAAVVGACDQNASEAFGKAGAKKIVVLKNEKLATGDPQLIAQALEEVAKKEAGSVFIFSHDFSGKAIAPRLAVKLKAGFVPASVSIPVIDNNNFTVTKTVFSGKATATYLISSDKKVISILPNSFSVENTTNTASLEEFNVSIAGDSKLKIKELKKSSKEGVALPDAELVVSAGRGLKGPEHWGIIEELAKELGAATACSRPVSDMDWRPHHEHVGQTGIAIRPNLYIAVGISGAIQHLAGVNGSKTIVVINKDPEAPFFKAADYGIIGDAFEVVPKLTSSIKKFKSSH